MGKVRKRSYPDDLIGGLVVLGLAGVLAWLSQGHEFQGRVLITAGVLAVGGVWMMIRSLDQ